MRTLSYLVALVAGLLIWREARADDGPPGPKSPPPPSNDLACGAPDIPPCSGSETPYCQDGKIEMSCCPQGAKCNFRNAPFSECGDRFCVPGEDPGMCVPRQPRVIEAVDEADCKAKYGDWEPACVNGQVRPSCIPLMPTNYMGAGFNPRFQTCGGTACTTGQFIEDCFPVKTEGATCDTGWIRVCLQGRITERCAPAGVARSPASQAFVECGPGRCAIGTDAHICPSAP